MWRRSPRLEIPSALLPGAQRRGRRKGWHLQLPSTEEEWGSSCTPTPLSSPASRTGPLLGGAVGSSSAHTENVRTTNKISIKLSFVSPLCVVLVGEDGFRKPKLAFFGGWGDSS